jgi:hypothetical protein
MRYKIYTLVDITRTNQYRNETGMELARHQQQNFDTVAQTIGMRANLSYVNPPKVKIDKPCQYNLDGNELANIWIFEWEVDREDLFLHDDDPVGRLKEDFEFVPYISGLTETIKYDPAIFKPGVNISFEILR